MELYPSKPGTSQKQSSWDLANVRRHYPKGLALLGIKTCLTCFKNHTRTTDDAIMCKNGMVWFHCTCGSTLMLKLEARA